MFINLNICSAGITAPCAVIPAGSGMSNESKLSFDMPEPAAAGLTAASGEVLLTGKDY